MAANSSIEWTESTWNPLTGCTKISPGCKFCYAERFARRLEKMGNPHYARGFNLTMHPESLELPVSWKKPRTIFVNSMSDLFLEDVPLEFIRKVFGVMVRADWHRYQILTKRAERLARVSSELDWPPQIWMGVSVENERYLSRIEELRKTPAFIKFLSLEPLLGPLPSLDLEGIDWVIVGGESGPGARPMKKEWVIEIKDTCKRSGVPFFFKQWGGVNKSKTGRTLEGKLWNGMPNKKASEATLFA